MKCSFLELNLRIEKTLIIPTKTSLLYCTINDRNSEYAVYTLSCLFQSVGSQLFWHVEINLNHFFFQYEAII